MASGSDVKTSAPLAIPDRTWMVWAVGASFLFAFLRLLALRNSVLDLLPDEAQYWSWSRHPAMGYFSKPPMIAWLIAVTTNALGHDEWAVRLAAPIIHAATGIILAHVGRAVFSARVGFWTAVTYATLPGVSFSALIISTDVPLLFFWSLALLALWNLLTRPGWGWALVLGAAIGLGFLSKYAMGYFLLGMVVSAALGPRAQWRIAGRELAAAGLLAAAIVAPNLMWNARHGWATVGHTAANAHWQGFGLHLTETLTFAGAQFGVFGPILLAAFIARIALVRRLPFSVPERFLVAFSLPVLVLMIAQSSLSRAHANWAAVTYAAATVLVVAWLDGTRWPWLVKASAGLQIAVFALFTLLFAGGLPVTLPQEYDIFHQMRGWRNLAVLTLGRIAAMPPDTSLAADDREVMAELDYYTRGRMRPLVMAVGNGPPGNQFELENAIDARTGAHALLIARDADRNDILNRFATHALVEEWSIRAGAGRSRHYYVYDVSGFGGGEGRGGEDGR